MCMLKEHWDKPYRTDLRVAGLQPGQYELALNNATPIKVTAKQLANFLILIRPDGSVQAEVKP